MSSPALTHIDDSLAFTSPTKRARRNKAIFSAFDDRSIVPELGRAQAPQEGAYGPALVVSPGDYGKALRNLEIRYANPQILLNLPTGLPEVTLLADDSADSLTDTGRLSFKIQRKGGDQRLPLRVTVTTRSGTVPTAETQGMSTSSVTIPAGQDVAAVTVSVDQSSANSDSLVLKVQPDESYLVPAEGAAQFAGPSALTQMTLMSVPVHTPSGLIAWWKAEGNANDASGNGYLGYGSNSVHPQSEQ